MLIQKVGDVVQSRKTDTMEEGKAATGRAGAAQLTGGTKGSCEQL